MGRWRPKARRFKPRLTPLAARSRTPRSRAALPPRPQTCEPNRNQAAQELQRQQQQIQANQQYVQKQVADKLGPIYTQVMQRRGANVMVEIGQTLASGATLDVTNDVLTALNAALPTVATTAPAQAARPQTQPQGR